MKSKANIKPAHKASEKEPASRPVYFLSLTVENVRCFGPEQTLDLSDGNGRPAQWTILLGDNGVGKTTLLQCLAATVPFDYSEIDRLNRKVATARYIKDSKLRSEWRPYRDISGNDLLSVSSTFFSGDKLFNQSSEVTARSLYFMQTGPPLEDNDVLHRFNGFGNLEYEQFIDIVCFAYGATRRMGETSLSDMGEDDPTASLFDENATLRNAEEWLLQADYAASKPSSVQKRAQERRDRIKEILIEILPDVTDIRFAQLSEKSMKPSVEFKTPYGWVSIKNLGLGYKTLIAWMVDFASRMFERYSDSPNPLAEPAIVLVDEIDLHLHPKWQRSIMSFLSKLFPNTQFIATAHSPLVVQAATDANIALLKREGDHVIIDNDVKAIRGRRIDQVLTSDLFGLESARPPEMEDDLAERRKILSKGRLTKKDKERLRELEANIGPLPAGETPEEIEAMDIIRRAAERLK